MTPQDIYFGFMLGMGVYFFFAWLNCRREERDAEKRWPKVK